MKWLCPVCQDEKDYPYSIVPCGHSIGHNCLNRLRTCPICRGQFDSTIVNYALGQSLGLEVTLEKKEDISCRPLQIIAVILLTMINVAIAIGIVAFDTVAFLAIPIVIANFFIFHQVYRAVNYRLKYFILFWYLVIANCYLASGVYIITNGDVFIGIFPIAYSVFTNIHIIFI